MQGKNRSWQDHARVQIKAAVLVMTGEPVRVLV